ncbi:MAG: hypothetical protein J0I20_14110 [Chloroflexi bacterium]|nr:hypothetical protein [Chloroflexota bacterium]OJV92736.1 MAG: hypothetical protein BGO39_29635 [Chloroflexi bacterium 54-19]
MKMKRNSRETAPPEKAQTVGFSRTLTNPRQLAIMLCLVILTGLVLAACGDNTPTSSTAPGTTQVVNTPVQIGNVSSFSTTAASTTTAATTAGASTTSAATTGAATTAASATTAAATTAATTTTAAGAATTSAASGATPKTGGTLHLVEGGEPDLLDPAKTNLLISAEINDLIFDRLVYIGADGLPHPWVAESWEISDSGKTLTFKIRQGLKFHDGTALDAAAVKFSFDRILDPKTASPVLSQMGTLSSVDAPDASTAIFHFKDPYAPFFTNISLSGAGIVSPAAVAKFGDQFSRNPVGSGPFIFKSWTTGTSVILVKNPDYKNVREDDTNKGGPAYLDEIDFAIITEPGTRLAAFQQGSLDVYGLDPESADLILKDSNFNVFQWKTATNFNYLEFPDKAPWNDVKMRQVVAYGVDKKALADTAWSGYATVNPNPLPVGVAGWDSTNPGYNYDPDKAKSLLAELGYKANANGILEKDGKPLTMKITTYSGYAPQKRAVELIQANLKSLGIDASVQIIEFSSLSAMLKKGDFDIDLMRWTWPDPGLLSLLLKSPGWSGQTNNPDLDSRLAIPDSTLDPTARLAAVKTVEKYVSDQAFVVPLNTDWIQVGATKKVQGFKWDATGYSRYINVWLS